MKRIETKRTFDWDEFFFHKGPKWREKDYKFIKKYFPLHDLKGTLLDVGCGVGDGLRYLQSECKHVTNYYGLDFSEEAIRINRENTLMNDMIFWQHSIEKPFSKKFDNVICLQVLEHLKDPMTALTNLIKMTKENLIISVPNENARPDSDHMWSFNINDFKGISNDCFIGDNNIYCGVYKDG